jgi:hypothetical protein
MTGYAVILIGLWLGTFVMLLGASIVLLAVFGGGAALCVACRRLVSFKRKRGKPTETQDPLAAGDKPSA